MKMKEPRRTCKQTPEKKRESSHVKETNTQKNTEEHDRTGHTNQEH